MDRLVPAYGWGAPNDDALADVVQVRRGEAAGAQSELLTASGVPAGVEQRLGPAILDLAPPGPQGRQTPSSRAACAVAAATAGATRSSNAEGTM